MAKPEYVDASTWEEMHLKTTTYIQYFIDMSLYNNCDDETKEDVLWKKIESMVEHLNVFEGFINETVSLDMPLADEVLALLLLLGSLLGSWETLMVILVNSTPQGKLTQDTLKSSLLIEEARGKEHSFEHEALVT